MNDSTGTGLTLNTVGPNSCKMGGVTGTRGFWADERSLTADHAQALRRSKKRREREPLLYCKIITKWPLQSFLITLSAHILMISISVILFMAGYDILPIDFENLPLEINDQPWRPRDLAWTYRNEFDGYYDRTPASGYRVNSYFRANINLFYDAEGANVFTKERLKKIQYVENSLTAVGEYQNNYCQLNLTQNGCQSPISVIRFFDGTLSSISSVFYDPNFDNISGVLYEANTNNATKGDFQFFLGKSYEITPSSAFSSITRSIIPFGYPLQGYDDKEDYRKLIREFSVSRLKPTLVRVRETSDLFEFSFISDLLWTEEVHTQIMKDALCAIGSACFIFMLILVHTRSLWITCFAIFSIISCFVITNLIYRVVLDFQYFGMFHVVILFIVFGIGADDIFVFYDIWRNTGCELYPSLAHRLSDSYRRSLFSMLFTSITTSVAFFVCAISPLLATRSFGVFSGLVILVNYVSVSVYFPTVVLMYHTYFENFQWPCFVVGKRKWDNKSACGRAERSDSDSTDCIENKSIGTSKCSQQIGTTVKGEISCYAKNSQSETNSPIHVTENRQSLTTQININNSGTDRQAAVNEKPSIGVVNDTVESDEFGSVNSSPGADEKRPSDGLSPATTIKQRRKKSFMIRVFRDKYSRFVTNKIIRWLILTFSASVIIFFTIQASKLEPDNEAVNPLKDSHVYSIAERHVTNSFVLSTSDLPVIIYIVWGMYPNDMSDCKFSKPKCKGTRVWDPSFHPSSPEAQTAVKDMCDKMFGWSAETAAKYRVRTDITTGQYQINCYIHNFDTFLQEETAITGTDWDLTYNYTKSLSFMNDRPTFYNTSGFTSAYKHHIGVPISYWLSNRYTYNYTEDFFLFDALIGEQTGNFSATLKTDATRSYGNDLRYIGIQVNTTMTIRTLGYAEGLPIMNRWEEFVNNQMNQMPVGMNNGFQTSGVIWHWITVSEMLAENAVYGIIIGVSLALPILIIATGNVITGCLATFSMCCSTICAIGVIPFGGWKLGVIESLTICMVVGLTVDYVVHLAEGYTFSLHNDRFSRVCDMLDEVAVSVFFGSCTTLGASIFLFFAQLTFFLQFGIFMFSIIGFSVFFAMGMFVTLMGLCGPQSDTGNLVALYQMIRAWYVKKRVMPFPQSRKQLAPENMPPCSDG